MEDIITVVKGTELKVKFTAESDDTVDLTAGKYYINYYTTDKSKGLVCSNDGSGVLTYKENYEGVNTLLIRIPTENLDPGTLKCEATIYVYDSDFDDDPTKKDDVVEGELEPDTNHKYDGYRKEIVRSNTIIKIVE